MIFCTTCDLWNDPGPDTGWSWVVAFSCCWITMLMYGAVRASGFLYVAVIENFSVSRQDAAQPFSVMLSFSNFIGLCGSILLQFATMRQIVIGGSIIGSLGVVLCFFAKSVHWLTFSIGVLTGSGIGLSTSFLTVLLSEYFVKKRTTANGIWLAGRSISGFVFPPLIFILLDSFGLEGTFLILGGILSNTLVGAFFLRPRTFKHFPLGLTRTFPERMVKEEAKYFLQSPSEELKDSSNYECLPKRPDSIVHCKKQSTFKQSTFFKKGSKYLKTCCSLARNPVYILNIFTDSYHAFTITATSLTLVDYSLDIGFTRDMALMILLSVNVSDLVARVFTGFISDRGYLSRPTLVAVTLSASGGALLAITFANSPYTVLFLCALYGASMGCAIINIVAFYREYMSQEELAIGIGVGNFIKGFIFLLQSVLIGYFRDEVGNYAYLYYTFAIPAPILGCLWILILTVRKCNYTGENSMKRTINT